MRFVVASAFVALLTIGCSSSKVQTIQAERGDAEDWHTDALHTEQLIDRLASLDDIHTHKKNWSKVFITLCTLDRPAELFVISAHLFDSRQTAEVQAVDSGLGPGAVPYEIGDALFFAFLSHFYDPSHYMDRSFAPYLTSKESAKAFMSTFNFSLPAMLDQFMSDKQKARSD